MKLNDLKREGEAPTWLTEEGLKTLRGGYMLDGETPREMYLRVARAAAHYKSTPAERNSWADRFFDAMWKNWLCPASPVLSNMGTTRGLPISCLTGDTWLNTPTGGIQIKDVTVGTKLLTHEGRYRSVIGIQSRQTVGDLYVMSVGTRTTPLRITGNHPVLTNLGWVHVDELDPRVHFVATNHYIESTERPFLLNMRPYVDHAFTEIDGRMVKLSTNKLARKRPKDGLVSYVAKVRADVPVSTDLAWALGLWCAEGSLTRNPSCVPNGARITMGQDEEPALTRWLGIMTEAFGVNGKVSFSEATRENFAYGRTTRWANATVNGKPLGRFFQREFGDNCKDKVLPQWLLDLPKEHLHAFLDGLLEGDGHYKPNGSWSIALANPKLLLGVYTICLKLGIAVSLQMQAKPSSIGKTKHVYVLRSIKEDSIKLARYNVDSGIVFGKLRYCPILRLDKLPYDAEVFDVQVEEDHSFSAAGVVVHNCNSIHVGDSVDSIFTKAHELAMLSKHGAGVGIYLGDVRGRGAAIGANGASEGVIPWAKVYDSTIVSVSQGATRRGAGAIYLPVEHPDIEEFISLRRPTGDANRRCLNINHAVTITDSFMESMLAGDAHKRRLWQEILRTRVETGEPYMMFIDTVNKAAPEAYKKHNLKIKTSNICCLAGDTLVLTREHGPVAIQDLVGKEVSIFDGHTWVKNDSFEMRGHDTLYAITLADGSIVEANGNHRWFVARNYSEVQARRHKEVLTKDLDVGTFLEFHEQEHHGTQEECGAYLKGFLLGDGTATQDESKALPILMLHSTKFACVDALVLSCSEIPPQSGLRSDAITEPHFGEVQSNPDAWGRQVFRRMKGLTARRDVLGPWASTYKNGLPATVWAQWTRDSKLRFLSGLFDADACWAACNMQWSTKSEQLLDDVKLMLTTLGIRSAKSQVNRVYRLNIYAHGAMMIFNAGYLRRLSAPKREANRNQTGWRRIISVEKLDKVVPVYCPRVPSTGKFALANGLMTGNSEITLHTDPDHSFVCCLSSLNLARWDEWQGTELPSLAVHFLDGALSEYIEKGAGIKGLENSIRSAVKGRAIGIGVLGWHSLLQRRMIAFDSLQAMMLNAEVFRTIRQKADVGTRELAVELGEPEWCEGTGTRHTHLMAIAPTVSNSIIAGGQSAGIEPLAANVYHQKTAKGTFIRRNPTLEETLSEFGLNNAETWKSIVEHEGSVQHLEALPLAIRKVYLTAREINQHALVRQAAQRQQWIDQGQSLNLFFAANASAKYIHEVHLEAWRSKIKTLYYLRSSGVLRGDLASRSSGECTACEG